MGFIRGGLSIFAYTLLFVSLLALGSFLTLSSSLEFENVKDKIVPLVHGLGDSSSEITKVFGSGEFNFSQASDEAIAKMRIHCQNYTDYVFDYQGSTIAISCATLESGGKEAVLNETLNGFVESVYYQSYDCNFWNCLEENKLPLFLVSQKAKDYWQHKFYLSLLASLLLVAVIFLVSENRTNTPIVVGIFLAISAIPILKVSALLSAILGPPFSLFFGIFFSQASQVFWILFLSGLALIGVGVALKVLNLDFVKRFIQKSEEKRSEKNQQDSTSPKNKGKKKK